MQSLELLKTRFGPPTNHRDWFKVTTTAAALVVTSVALGSILSTPPKPLKQQPFPDAQEYADAAHQLVSGNGYVTYIHNGEPEPPRYPPGFSLALAPFAAIGNYPANVQMGTKIYAAGYLLITVVTAWLLGGSLAGALAALLIGVSPFARTYAALVMSDAFAAAGTIVLLFLLQRLSSTRVSVGGFLAGALVVVRFPMVINIIALLIALPSKFRLRLVVFALPAFVALGLFQWSTFGSPLKTGYDYWVTGIRNFDPTYALKSLLVEGPWITADALGGRLMQWVCPCPVGGPQAALPSIVYYPAVLIGLFWLFAPPFITLLGLGYVWKHRREAAPGFAFCLSILSLIFYTVYFYQGARFIAAPATLLAVYASVVLAHWIGKIVNPHEWQKKEG